jgi:alkylmercury lyase
VLSGWPNVHRNEGGDVVAFGGLSLIATPHRFEVDGRELFTWCAWDTMFLPALLGQPAIVRSTCPITGDGVRLNVAPARVVAADPAGLQVSFPAPGAARAQDITGSFCCHVHFLAGQPAGTAWLANHPSGLVLSVRDAFLLGQLVTAALLTGVRFDDGAHAGLPAPQPQGAPVRLLARVLLPAHCGRTRAEVVPAAGRAPVGRARGQANS